VSQALYFGHHGGSTGRCPAPVDFRTPPRAACERRTIASPAAWNLAGYERQANLHVLSAVSLNYASYSRNKKFDDSFARARRLKASKASARPKYLPNHGSCIWQSVRLLVASVQLDAVESQELFTFLDAMDAVLRVSTVVRQS
jgi:hypothetical protein